MASYRLALLLVLVSAAWGQSVVSVRSGLINFSDGAVFVDGQQLEPRPGKFQEIKEGSELYTQAGRAEILLTPGVFLRLGDHTAIRMVSNRFRDTRVQFLRGSAILESTSPSPDTAVTMIYGDILYGDFQVRFMKDGRYRMNSLPPELRVTTGEAEVAVGGKSATVEESHRIRLSMPLVAQKLESDPGDRLDGWSDARAEAISAGNAQTANSADLSAAVDAWQGSPDPYAAYAPPFGLPTYGQSPAYSYSPLTGYSSVIGAPYGAFGIGVPMYVPLYRYTTPTTYGYRPPLYGTLGSRLPGTLGGSPPSSLITSHPTGLITTRPPGLSAPRPVGIAHPVGIGGRR